MSDIILPDRHAEIAVSPLPAAVEGRARAGGNRLRLLSYNIQAGAAASRFRHYVTHSWKHVLPHSASLQNLDSIAAIVRDFDIVALQEVDAGSLRSYFINQVEYLAKCAGFPYWYHQTNRNLGKLGQFSNGLLSRVIPAEVIDYRLPGVIPGRGAIFVRYGQRDASLVLLLVHLALSRRARLKQLAFLIDLVNEFPHVVLMGDFNCQLQSREIQTLLANTTLHAPVEDLPTFPSWRPFRTIDHILITPSLKLSEAKVLHCTFSDHLPVTLDIEVPSTIDIKRSAPADFAYALGAGGDLPDT
jgi:endonuclease/exonuclease/phosphatase family metal-dependent hydrolase